MTGWAVRFKIIHVVDVDDWVGLLKMMFDGRVMKNSVLLVIILHERCWSVGAGKERWMRCFLLTVRDILVGADGNELSFLGWLGSLSILMVVCQ